MNHRFETITDAQLTYLRPTLVAFGHFVAPAGPLFSESRDLDMSDYDALLANLGLNGRTRTMTAFGRSADIRVRVMLQDPAHAFERGENIADWNFHACRHTVATWLKAQGRSEFERALVLNHSESSVTAEYSHGHAVDLMRDLLERLAEHVAELVQPKGAVRLTQRRACHRPPASAAPRPASARCALVPRWPS